jgi:probable HAF family extracellular repeat protein
MRIVTRMSVVLYVASFFAVGPLAPDAGADAIYQVTNLGNNQIVGLTASGQVVETYNSGAPSYQLSTLLYTSYGSSAGQQTFLPLYASAVSSNGTVTGYVGESASSATQAVNYNVNTPGVAPTPIVSRFSGVSGVNSALAVNDSGQTVGSSSLAGTSDNRHAFLSSGGTITDLGTLGAPQSGATAINNLGQVTGNFGNDMGTGGSQAFLYSAGKMINIGGLPGYTFSSGTAINNSGQVAGSSQNADGTAAPFLYSNGHMVNLGTVPGDTSAVAEAINSQGVVVGNSWHLGTLTSGSNAPNNNAFIYENGVMTNLNSLIPSSADIHLVDAHAINDSGQILAYGLDSYGDGRVYLLTPDGMPAPLAPVLFGNETPEPSTLAFVVLLGALAGAKWVFSR